MRTRSETTLFLMESLDGKISTGSTDNLDVDKDFKRIHGLKEGLHQYYDLKKQTDPFSLNSGRVIAKIRNWLSSLFITDPNSLVLVEWQDSENKTKQEVMTAGMVDNLSEVFFGRRKFGTKKGCVFKHVDGDPNNYKGYVFSNTIKFNFQLVERSKDN